MHTTFVRQSHSVCKGRLHFPRFTFDLMWLLARSAMHGFPKYPPTMALVKYGIHSRLNHTFALPKSFLHNVKIPNNRVTRLQDRKSYITFFLWG